MNSRALALLAALSTLAVCVSVMGEFVRRVDSLRSRLEAEQAERRRSEVRAVEDERRARAERERLERTLEESRAGLKALDARVRTRDIPAMMQDILAPSVQINGGGGVGGGTLIYSRPGHTYVITAWHVVQKAVLRDEDGERHETVEVRIFDGSGRTLDAVEAELTGYHEAKDLALLRLHTRRVYPGVARLASRDTLRRVRVFEPIYAVGCPLGHDPLPTPGEIATLRKEVGGERFWMMNAPTIFGNSGGGIFQRETREMIGVSVMVCTYDGVVSTPVPHLGILTSLDTVYDWLDSLHYGFIYDPSLTREACEAARRAEQDRRGVLPAVFPGPSDR